MAQKTPEKPRKDLKVGMEVEVIAGKDKGRTGKILRIHRKESRVVVAGVNTLMRHTKPNAQNQKGGIISFEAPIHWSNVKPA